MRFLKFHISIFCCLMLLIGGCGDEPDEKEIILTGTLGLPPAAMETDAPVLVAMRAPGLPEPRITLSARVLDAALSKHMMITGKAKRNALDRAQSSSRQQAPVRAVLEDMVVHWAA